MQRLVPHRPWRLLAGALALALIAGALHSLGRASAGVEVVSARLGPTPVTVYRSTDAAASARAPAVVVAHGFAGSQQLMTPFAATLARNGYVAVTFDFYGHGRNLRPLAGNVTQVEGATRWLVRQTREVSDYALSMPGTGNGLAVLGHSMASDIVVRYALSDPRVAATVAVSMFSPAVTADGPRNLLVISGGWERFLQQEALRAVGMVTEDPRPGVTYGDFVDGSARRAAISPNVEHVGVLYSAASMREAVAWLDQAFGRDREITSVDRRGWAIVSLLLGVGLLAWPLAALLPTVSSPPRGADAGWRMLLPAGLVPAIATPLLLWRFPADFLSVLVGGYLAVHFGVYGLTTAAVLWWRRRRAGAMASSRRRANGPSGLAGEPDATATRPGGGSSRPALAVLAVFLASAYVAGIMALVLDTWLTSFAVTPPRRPLVFAMLAGTLCYFLADEWLTRGAGTPRGARVFTRACFLLSLALAVALSFEELFFLLIIAAVILIYFVLYGLFSGWIYRATGHPAVGAVANAVAFAWALAAVFPLLSGA